MTAGCQPNEYQTSSIIRFWRIHYTGKKDEKMSRMITYGRVVDAKCEEKKPAIIIVNNGHRRVPIEIPQDYYQKLINKNGGTFMMQEVEVYREKNGMVSIKVFD